ncbi:MAG: S8 family serine peptidase, partial [Fimbriimonadia bacterium]|nr:S8 family serine peptidase [Fimbriimonadia bacterium]
THTAGTVGAVGNNGIGVTGVNWRCKLAALRFLGPQGGTTSNAILAVQYCTNKGIKVSNNSWGGGSYSTSLYNAINASKSVNHVFVAAAGNNNRNIDSSPFYPASYNLDNIISVAAVDNNFARASFSNYGATSVDLGAPGVTIASTYINSNYAYMDGTSMACPHVAGVVALVYGQNTGWTYTQVRNRILSTVRPVSSMNNVTVTGGVVNAQAAVTATNTPPTVSITAPTNGATVTQSTSVTFTGSASDTQDGNLSANLSWSSNLQGNIGSGASFSTSSLQVGTHTITASVTDSGGLPGSANITINVVNTAPTVTISSPANNSTTSFGASVTFTGSASDTQDGNLSANLSWSSNLQGNIGSGASFSTSSLQVGTHTITASVTDSGGLVGSATRTITVQQVVPVGPTNLTVTHNSGQVECNWNDNSNNEDGFTMVREVNLGGVWSNRERFTLPANTTSFTDTPPGDGLYRYRVHAFNSAGTSTTSGWVQVTVVTQSPPNAPSNLSVVYLNGQVECTWTDNANNEDGFTMVREIRINGVWVNRERFDLPANTTFFSDVPPGPGTYRYRVHAYNTAGTSATSGWKQVVVP